MNNYEIVYENCDLTDILAQLNAIEEFPAHINFYDKKFLLVSEDELCAFIMGFKISWPLASDYWDASAKKEFEKLQQSLAGKN